VLAAAAAAVRLLGPRHAPSLEVFFVQYGPSGRVGSLVMVRRPAAPGSRDARLEAALRALLAGPSPEERKRGLVSEIPPDTSLRDAHVDGRVAVVDLTAPFAGGGGSTSMLARVWQVVYTATQVPGVDAVQILVEGRRVQALGGEGLLIGAPLRRPASLPTF
jgi:germination protein M